MGARIVCALTAVAGGAILLGQMKASGFPDRDKMSLSGDLPGAGPLLGADIDIAVSRLGLSSAPNNPSDNFAYWGTSGGIRAFSMASTSCNVGNAVAQWVAGGSGNHPVIAQNMFRYLDGRFEQIGQSWLKHSSCAVNEDTCGTCQDTSCSTLGLGCADTYSSFLNDGAGIGMSGLNVGMYHAFSSAPGDAVNGIFDPSRLIIVAHPSIVTDAQAGDARLARKVVPIPSVDDQAGEGVSTDRAFDIYDGPSAPIAYMRNEELILLRADANLGLGIPAGIDAALPDINFIRQESGGLAPIALAAWQAMTDTQRTDELLYNRRYSLLFEGHRWIDMRRYGRLTALPIDAGTTFVRFSRFPFPVRECNARVPPPTQGCALELGF